MKIQCTASLTSTPGMCQMFTGVRSASSFTTVLTVRNAIILNMRRTVTPAGIVLFCLNVGVVEIVLVVWGYVARNIIFLTNLTQKRNMRKKWRPLKFTPGVECNI